MSTAGPLTDWTKKELAEQARRKGIRDWDSLSKEDLIKALSRTNPVKAAGKMTPKPNRAAMPTKLTAKQVSRPLAKPSMKQPNKPVAKAISKPVTKLLPKPAAKSAAKVTKPTKPETTSRPAVVRSTPPAPAVNGAHRLPATTNGTPAPTPKLPTPPTLSGSPPKPLAKAPVPPMPAATKTPGTKPEASPSTVAKPLAAKPTAPKPPVTKPLIQPGPQSRDATKEPAAQKPLLGGPTKDRIIMAVHDPYWLHVYWELSTQSVQRAEAALRQDWYGAKLIIRLYDVTSQDTTSTSETPIRDIPIETDGSNWYVNVSQPPRQYRADLGYLSRRGDFFILARSNVVTPPKAGSSEAIDVGWNIDNKKAERILAMSTGFESSGNPELREMFEERLKRSLGAPKETGFGTGATPPGSLKKFFFEIDARLIVFGRTDPTAHLTLGNDPIELNTDGRFVMSFSLPDSRQIIPAVATSADGVEERTIVLAVERNTKYLDPMIHDQMNEL